MAPGHPQVNNSLNAVAQRLNTRLTNRRAFRYETPGENLIGAEAGRNLLSLTVFGGPMPNWTRAFKRVLVAAISIQIALPHAYVQAGDTGGEAVAAPAAGVQDFLQKLESGALAQESNRAYDIFNLTDQRIEIFTATTGAPSKSYDLNQMQVEIPTVAFTDLRVSYDAQNKSLVLEALRGVGATAGSGVVVARHVISHLDIVNFAQDAELLQMVDREGRVHVLDMGLAKTNAFKHALPVVKDLWRGDVLRTENRVGFITRGSSGLQVTANSLVPRNEKGEVVLAAGDFYIADKSSGEIKAVLARDVTYETMTRAYKVLAYQSALVTPDLEVQKTAEKAIEGLDGRLSEVEAAVNLDKENPALDTILSSFDEKTRAAIKSRGAHVGSLKDRARDSFGEPEWMSALADIQKNAGTASMDEVERDWYKFMSKHQPKMPTVDAPKTVFAKLRQKLSVKNGLRAIAGILAVSSVTYLGYNYGHDFFYAQEYMKVINWAYANLYPDVLKDATYRTPLLLSMASLAAIWPEAVAFSALVGKTLRQMAAKLDGSTSARAIYIKDLAKNWGPLSNWQRITSFGMRLYAWLILPYWRVAIDHLLAQKSFFPAVNNGLNPFEKVLANSEMGRKLGLTEDQRLGLNAIFGRDRREQQIAMNQKIQSEKGAQNKRVDRLAILIASTVLAEKYKTDPATIFQVVAQDGAATEAGLDTPEMQKERALLTDLLLREMKELRRGGISGEGELGAAVEKYYTRGRELLAHLDQSSSLRKNLLEYRRRFLRASHSAMISAANFGKEDHEFLKKVFTDDFVSSQVKQEFTIDHLMVVAIVGLYGERADLSHPEHLAADAHGLLWTSKAHWFDIFMNTFSHFFVSGAATALVFQKVKATDAVNYGPVENFIYETKARTQGLASAMYTWTKDVATPWKADMGGIIIRRLLKRTTTLTAGLTMTFVLRAGVFGNDVSFALAAWFFNFIAAQWFFGWIWDPIQRGNQMERERFEKMENDLKDARYELMRGDEAKGREAIEALYRQNNPSVLSEYKLAALSKDQVLDLTMLQPPVYTQRNAAMSWITNWAGAVGSTVLAIPLSVILMDHNLLMDSHLYTSWMMKSALLYGGAYLLLGKTPWQYYFAAWDKVKVRIGGGNDGREEAPSRAGAVRCEGLFHAQ